MNVEKLSINLSCWGSMIHHWTGEIEGIDSYAEFPPHERLMPRRS